MSSDFEVNDDGVTLRTDTDEEFRVRFLVDGAGYRSPLATRFGLREKPDAPETQSRSIFTHMVGIKHYDECLHEARVAEPLLRLGGGHPPSRVRGGWLWIIPFNNVEGSTNPLCSVGLTLNMKRYPDTGMPAEEEFFHFINRFPSARPAVRRACQAVRELDEDRLFFFFFFRLQYSATGGAGDRYFLLAHAHGFIGALYSRGLHHQLRGAIRPRRPAAPGARRGQLLARPFRLRRAAAARHAAAERPGGEQPYRSFPNYALWNAWLRVWLIAEIYGDLRLFSVCVKYLETQDKSVFDLLEKDP